MNAHAFILSAPQLFWARFLRSRPRILLEWPEQTEDDKALQTSEHRSVRSAWGPAAEPQADAQYASNWFAVYTTSRHEKRVAQHLGQRQIEYYLPLYRSQRKWSDGSRVTLDLPLFPGYIFVHINRAERVRVLCVPGALAVVGGNGREPVPLPDSAIEALRTGLQLHPVEPHPLLTVGQRARIRSGAFAGMVGVVMRNKNCCRVVLTLEHIMQSVAVELDAEDLEPLDSGDSSSAARSVQ
jgi:transcription antitermination factor NusG